MLRDSGATPPMPAIDRHDAVALDNAQLKAAALQAVNHLRTAYLDSEPLAELPKAYRGRSFGSCLVGQAFDGDAAIAMQSAREYHNREDGRRRVPYVPVLDQLERRFERGNLPELAHNPTMNPGLDPDAMREQLAAARAALERLHRGLSRDGAMAEVL